MSRGSDDQRDALAAEAAVLLGPDGAGLTARVRDLFTYLLETSLAGVPVKEFDIAHVVFGRGADFEAAQDASIRVYVHRLRKRLDDYYLRRPERRCRVVIPKGEYCLQLAEAGDEDRPVTGRPRWHQSLRLWQAVAAVALVLALLGAVLALRNEASPAERNARALATTGLWSGLGGAHGRAIIAVGDYYMVGEEKNGKVESLVRRFEINSRTDLDTFAPMNPNGPQYVDLGLHYLPLGAAWAVRDVVPQVNLLSTGQPVARIVPMSDLTAEMVKASDLVYVGYLSALGRLQEAVFAGSRLQVGDTFDELVDRKTGKRYVNSALETDDGTSLHREYAYLAALRGPAGNRMIVIAGTRDAGMIAAATLAADPRTLRAIDEALGGRKDFEALFEVQASGLVSYGLRRILIAPIDTTRTWSGTD